MIKYVKTEQGIKEAIKYLDKLNMIGLDTEANGLNPTVNDLLLIQLGNEIHQYVFDVYKLGKSISLLISFLNTCKGLLIAHNMKFDYKMLKHHLGFNPGRVACTYIGEKLLTQGKRIDAGLADVANKYLRTHLDKDERSTFIGLPFGSEFTSNQIKYSGEDVQYLIPAYQSIQKLLNERGMRKLSIVEYESTKLTGDLELNGIYINTKAWLALKTTAEKEAKIAKKELDSHFLKYCQIDLFGDPVINYKSVTQIKPILSKLCGFTLKTTEEKYLKALESSYPVIKALFNYRRAVKKIDTYGQSFVDQHVREDGRIYSTFLQLGAETGRFSSRNPNLTNIPRAQEYRTPFEAPDKTRKIICADYAQQELKLLAFLSQEPAFLTALREGKDLHCYSACIIYDIPYEDFFDKNGKLIKEMGIKYRQPAKSLNFGIVYGIGAKRLADNLKIDIKEASALLKKYFQVFPGIASCMNTLMSKGKENKYALSPLDGRRRDLSSGDWDNPGVVNHYMNICKNIPFQGAGASVTKHAGCLVRRSIIKHNWDAKIVNIVHDSENRHD